MATRNWKQEWQQEEAAERYVKENIPLPSARELRESILNSLTPGAAEIFAERERTMNLAREARDVAVNAKLEGADDSDCKSAWKTFARKLIKKLNGDAEDAIGIREEVLAALDGDMDAEDFDGRFSLAAILTRRDRFRAEQEPKPVTKAELRDVDDRFVSAWAAELQKQRN